MRQVHAEYQTYLKNKENVNIVYAHVDSVNVFGLIEDILAQRRNNAMNTFSRYTDIEDWLRDQWAGYFRELLKRTTESHQIASLSSQVIELAELNKTLRTYLENMMKNISPDSRSVIESESNRLEEIRRENALEANTFVRFLKRRDIPTEKAREILEMPTLDTMIERLAAEIGDKEAAKSIKVIVTEDQGAQADINEARKILSKKLFDFEKTKELA